MCSPCFGGKTRSTPGVALKTKHAIYCICCCVRIRVWNHHGGRGIGASKRAPAVAGMGMGKTLSKHRIIPCITRKSRTTLARSVEDPVSLSLPRHRTVRCVAGSTDTVHSKLSLPTPDASTHGRPTGVGSRHLWLGPRSLVRCSSLTRRRQSWLTPHRTIAVAPYPTTDTVSSPVPVRGVDGAVFGQARDDDDYPVSPNCVLRAKKQRCRHLR